MKLKGHTEGPKGVIRIQEVPIPYVRLKMRGRDCPDNLASDNCAFSKVGQFIENNVLKS